MPISKHPEEYLPFLGHFFYHDFHLPAAPAFSTFSTQCCSTSTPSPWQHHFFGALAPNFITINTSRRQEEPASACFESTQPPSRVIWGWGDILVPKLCVGHLTACTGTAETRQHRNCAATAWLLWFLPLLTYWLCREGKSPLKEPWGTQTTNPTSFLRIPTWNCMEGTQSNWNVAVYCSPGNYSNQEYSCSSDSHSHRRGWDEAQLWILWIRDDWSRQGCASSRRQGCSVSVLNTIPKFTMNHSQKGRAGTDRLLQGWSTIPAQPLHPSTALCEMTTN